MSANYFCKAKFPPVVVDGRSIERADAKMRTDNRDTAFAWAASQLDDGAASIVIRPESRNAA
jgi:hypothetical protein